MGFSTAVISMRSSRSCTMRSRSSRASGALEGDYRGHDGVRRWWSDLLDLLPDYRAEIAEVQDLGDMMLGHIRGRAHGLPAPRPSSRSGGSRSCGATDGASGGATLRRKLMPWKPSNRSRDEFSCDG